MATGTKRSPRGLTADEEVVMRALPLAIRALVRQWDADLTAAHGLSQVEYTVLRVLSESPTGVCRLSQLADECQQSLSAVSRTVGRVERLGLVDRRPCADDGRAAEAVLTDAGRDKLRAAWPDHLASIRESLFRHLDGVDLHALGGALERIASAGPHQPGRAQPHRGPQA